VPFVRAHRAGEGPFRRGLDHLDVVEWPLLQPFRRGRLAVGVDHDDGLVAPLGRDRREIYRRRGLADAALEVRYDNVHRRPSLSTGLRG
jgi:hypothetical protein